MAFGVDDALTTASAAIGVADTLVRTVQSYKDQEKTLDFEKLIDEIRVTIRHNIDEADYALMRFELTLKERGVNLDKQLQDVVNETPFWRPFEKYRLSQFQKRLTLFQQSVYAACDDIAALARCQGTTELMGSAVATSSSAKHEFHMEMLNASSVRQAIDILRDRLAKQKYVLN